MKAFYAVLLLFLGAFLGACSSEEEVVVSKGNNLNEQQIQSNYAQDLASYAGLEHVFSDNTEIALPKGLGLIIFGKNDCEYCEKLKRDIKASARLQSLLAESFSSYYINLSYQKTHALGKKYLSTAALAKKFAIRPTPTLVFLDKNGDELYAYPGYMREAQFVRVLEFLANLKDVRAKDVDRTKLAIELQKIIESV